MVCKCSNYFEAVEFITRLRRENMAGRPKDPTINHKIFDEIDRLLVTTHFRDITIDQFQRTQVFQKQRFIVVGKINHRLL